jgi:hypothetical protein
MQGIDVDAKFFSSLCDQLILCNGRFYYRGSKFLGVNLSFAEAYFRLLDEVILSDCIRFFSGYISCLAFSGQS